jgi:hypothetical protein
VRKEGVEPPRPFGHRILSPARLPVPPLPRNSQATDYTGDLLSPVCPQPAQVVCNLCGLTSRCFSCATRRAAPPVRSGCLIRTSVAPQKRPGSSILICAGTPGGCFPGKESSRSGVPSRISLQAVATENRAIFGADGVLAKHRLNKQRPGR